MKSIQDRGKQCKSWWLRSFIHVVAPNGGIPRRIRTASKDVEYRGGSRRHTAWGGPQKAETDKNVRHSSILSINRTIVGGAHQIRGSNGRKNVILPNLASPKTSPKRSPKGNRKEIPKEIPKETSHRSPQRGSPKGAPKGSPKRKWWFYSGVKRRRADRGVASPKRIC